MQKITWCAGLVLPAALCAACLVLAADTPSSATRSANMDLIKPLWGAGDSWVVETASLPIQVRSDLDPTVRSKPIQWQFTVQRYEKVIGDDCYRVVVKCLEPGTQPTTVLWIDRKTQTLRQIETEIPVRGGFKKMVENYQFSGQKSAVLGPLTALPIDMPFFQGNRTKGLETYVYEANMGPAGKKALGEIGFTYEVEQDVSMPSSQNVKGLLPDAYSKDLNTRPVVEIRLRSAGRQVRQLWRPGLPWPVYADNGITVSRLVKVTSAPQSGN
jgi:hypothetical protein